MHLDRRDELSHILVELVREKSGGTASTRVAPAKALKPAADVPMLIACSISSSAVQVYTVIHAGTRHVSHRTAAESGPWILHGGRVAPTRGFLMLACIACTRACLMFPAGRALTSVAPPLGLPLTLRPQRICPEKA